MSPSLASRIEDIPGVAAVTVDLTDSGGGINMRLEPGADQSAVIEKVRTLLAAYGAKPEEPVLPQPGSDMKVVAPTPKPEGLGVDLKITPIQGGARVEVAAPNVRSFRIVAANPTAIAQGVADAWCQVTGRIPVEIASVKLNDSGVLQVVSGPDDLQGSANISLGWEKALAHAVGQAIGAIDTASAKAG